MERRGWQLGRQCWCLEGKSKSFLLLPVSHCLLHPKLWRRCIECMKTFAGQLQLKNRNFVWCLFGKTLIIFSGCFKCSADWLDPRDRDGQPDKLLWGRTGRTGSTHSFIVQSSSIVGFHLVWLHPSPSKGLGIGTFVELNLSVNEACQYSPITRKLRNVNYCCKTSASEEDICLLVTNALNSSTQTGWYIIFLHDRTRNVEFSSDLIAK